MITLNYENYTAYYFNESDNYQNGTTVYLEVTDNITMVASVSCSVPAVNLTWTGPGEINNNKVVLCADNSTFASQSELRIDNATKNDTKEISLHYSHPLLTETYQYRLKVNGRYMIFRLNRIE